MGYYIDLEKISIEDYNGILKLADLLPSRMILKDNIGLHDMKLCVDAAKDASLDIKY